MVKVKVTKGEGFERIETNLIDKDNIKKIKVENKLERKKKK